MKPAVIEPSQIPRMKRTTKSPPNEVQAACAARATAHVKMLILSERRMSNLNARETTGSVPHPLSNREPLQREVLGVFEDQV